MIGDDNYAADYGPAARDEARRREEEAAVRRRIDAAVAAERARCLAVARGWVVIAVGVSEVSGVEAARSIAAEIEAG